MTGTSLLTATADVSGRPFLPSLGPTRDADPAAEPGAGGAEASLRPVADADAGAEAAALARGAVASEL